eukprot:TRINITY_DN3069_c0_g2_i1.p1 TRINITY_DN3069_c0_g2~~TRINITY_DN3069_c0_g2_i1.p1  ORF type:complete len:139 (+),score=38.27 TRINITY_DN3069_c0_g2_i1:74-490(+)
MEGSEEEEVRVLSVDRELQEEEIHLLPFRVHFEGFANVKTYFKQTGDSELERTFRGRPMNGRVVKLSNGMEGIVLEKGLRPGTGMEMEKIWTPIAKFSHFIIWSWDRPTMGADSEEFPEDRFEKALEWIDIAQKIHDA